MSVTTAPPPVPASSAPPALSRAQRFAAAGAGAQRSLQPAGASTPAPTLPASTAAPDEIIGLLERFTVYNNWGLGTAFTDDRKAVTVTGGVLADLVEGNDYIFKGRFVFNRKLNRQGVPYGEQFEVSSAAPFMRPDRASISRYIQRNFKSVGPVTAEKFLTQRLKGAADEGAALEAIRQQLLEAPWTVDFSNVSKKAKFKADETSSPALAYVHRDLATRLGGLPGMRDGTLKLLAGHLLAQTVGKKEGQNKTGPLDPLIVQKCWSTLVKDPYDPISSITGYAFAMADAIGASANIPRDAPVRLKALVAHALNAGCQRGGHVYLTREQLSRSVGEVDPSAPVSQAIEHGISNGLIMLDEEFAPHRFYTTDLHDAEVSLAKRIVQMCIPTKPLVSMPQAKLREKIQAAAKKVSASMVLDASQMDALVGILTSTTRIHTLTAGPGCGKTALMEILSEVLKSKDIKFCGPTGKSAKVLNNRLAEQGRSASTIHSLLRGAGRNDFQHNAENPLEGDILVGDETSMNDVEMADGLLAAANDRMHVILLGDADQLASVGPGSVLRDLMDINRIDHHRLSTTHRNSGGILSLIEQVRGGQIDCEDAQGVSFSHGLGDAQAQFASVATKYINAVTKHGFENVILLMSMRKGEVGTPGWNTTYANAVLRDLCNPRAEKVPGTRLFVGDRIIIRENMVVRMAGAKSPPTAPARAEGDEPGEDDTRVVNGDTGTITSYERDVRNPKNAGPAFLRVKLDDGRLIEYPGNSCEFLQHAYALTVHSAQGSEYKHVIVVATPGHSSFINRTMLFTGLSRARGQLDVNASDDTLRKIASTPAPKRNSSLVERVQMEFSSDGSAEKGEPEDGGNDDDDDEGGAREVRTPSVGTRPAPITTDKTARVVHMSFRERWAMRART